MNGEICLRCNKTISAETIKRNDGLCDDCAKESGDSIIEHIDKKNTAERVKCKLCNNMILADAIEKNEGMCESCSKKEKIESPTEKDEEKAEKKSIWGNRILRITGLLSFFPVFIIAIKHLPNPEWKYHTDRILIFLLTMGVVKMCMIWFRPIVILGFIICFGGLSYGSFSGNYGFESFFNDYKQLIIMMGKSDAPEKVLSEKMNKFPHKSEVLEAIDYNNEEIIQYSRLAVRDCFSDLNEKKTIITNRSDLAAVVDKLTYDKYRQIIQCFAVFKMNQEKWQYVNDPDSVEYFCKASQSLENMSGDCDDYSIFTAATIKAISGRVRLTTTSNHMYPELYIGTESDFKYIEKLIRDKLFKDSFIDKIHHHKDHFGKYWINLDFNSDYPGGEFIGGKVKHSMEIFRCFEKTSTSTATN